MRPRIPHDSKSFKAWTAAAVTAAFLVPLGILGAPALAKSAASASQYEYSGSSQYQYKGKVTLCHHTHSRKHPWHQITVGAAAVKAHLRHGDTMGACPATAPAQQSKPQQGKGHGKGKGHDQSGSDDAQGAAQSGQAGTTHGKSGEHGKGHDK